MCVHGFVRVKIVVASICFSKVFSEIHPMRPIDWIIMAVFLVVDTANHQPPFVGYSTYNIYIISMITFGGKEIQTWSENNRRRNRFRIIAFHLNCNDTYIPLYIVYSLYIYKIYGQTWRLKCKLYKNYTQYYRL